MAASTISSSPSIDDAATFRALATCSKLQDCYDYKLLIIGITGAGKSSLCNFFFQEEIFDTDTGIISVTEKSTAHSHSLKGKSTLFIDTPGFSDDYETNEEHMNEMAEALLYAQNGVSAIVICINGGSRFDTASASLIRELEVLGAFWSHAMVVFTNARAMGKQETARYNKIKEWLKNKRCPEKFKGLLEFTKGRYMTVESYSEDPHYYTQKVNELICLVEQVLDHNSRQCFTNHLFKWAKDKYDEAKAEAIAKDKEAKEALKDLMDLKQKLKEHRQKETEMIQKYNDSALYLKSIEKEKLSLLKDREALIKSSAKLEEKVSSNEIQISNYKDQVASLKIDVQDSKAKAKLLKSTETNLKTVRDQYDKLKTQSDTTETKLENSKISEKTLLGKVKSLEKEIEDKTARLESLGWNLKLSESSRKCLERLETKHITTIGYLEKEKEDLRVTTINKMMKEAREKDTQITELSKQLNKYKTNADTYKSDADKYKALVEKYEGKSFFGFRIPFTNYKLGFQGDS